MRRCKPVVTGIRAGGRESSKKLLEFGGRAAQVKPLGENLRVLQPDCQPLGGFARGGVTISEEIELLFDLQDCLAQCFLIVRLTELFELVDKRVRGVDCLKTEFIRCEEMLF